MRYSEIKAQAKKKGKITMDKKKQKIPSSPINPPTLQSSSRKQIDEIEDIEQLVIEKYNGIKEFYDDINDPTNVVPNREEVRRSLNNLLLAEEKVKYNEMVLSYEKKVKQYREIIDSLIKIMEKLLNINE